MQLCGLKTPLTDIEPDTEHGRIVALAFAIAESGISSVVVGLVGAMAIVGDLVYFFEAAVNACCGMASRCAVTAVAQPIDASVAAAGSCKLPGGCS